MASATQDEYRALGDGWLLLQLFLHLEVGARHDKGRGKQGRVMEVYTEERRRVGNSKGRSTSAGEYNGKPLCWKALVGAGRIPKVGLWGKWQALRSTRVRTHAGIFQTMPRIDYVVLMTGLPTDRKLRLGVG